MAHSKRGTLPDKPRPDFPLYVHRSDRWAKKYHGQTYYYGKASSDPDGTAAHDNWMLFKEYDRTGRPRPEKGGDNIVRLHTVINEFLAHKEARRDSGELAPRTFIRYEATGKFLSDYFGRETPVEHLAPSDFEGLRAEMAKRWGPVALGVEIQTIRSMFKFALTQEIISKPARFGAGFDKPTAKVLRQNRVSDGPKMFTAEQIRKLLKVASPNMKAMLLLALNGGLGNTDLGELPIKAIDLKNGWLDYPRPKTAMPRKIPLWAQTIEAIKAAIAKRPTPKDPEAAGLLFIGRRGESYAGEHKGYRVAQEFAHAMEEAKIVGRTFYDLRRTFQTIAEGGRDLTAVQSIMGHAPASGDMSAVYRQLVDDSRLIAAVNVVRDWVFKKSKKPTDGARRKGTNKPKTAKSQSRTPRQKSPPAETGFILRIVG